MKRLFFAPCVWLAALAPALAIQQRQIEHLTPRGGARGTTVEVLLEGMDISSPREILFYRQGIRVDGFELLPPLEHPRPGFHGSQTIERVKVRFHIAADCPLGEHPLRLRTATTLTTLATFWVGPFPIVEESEKSLGENDTRDKAQAVSLNSTVNGRLHEGRALDLDMYRVDLKAGQRLSAELDCLRLSMASYGDAEYDAMLLALDAAGREIARNDDSGPHIQDPILSVLAPADGPYYVVVRQRVYKPFGVGFYHLHIGDYPRPLAAFPAGGPAGRTLSARLLGDPAGERTVDVDLPAEAQTLDFYPGDDGRQSPSPLALRSSPHPNTLEAEPNNDPASATPAATAACALNGIIASPGDVDYYRLPLVKGTSYRIRVFGRTLGSPLDPRIWLRPAADEAKPSEIEADDASLPERDLFGLAGTMRPKELLDPSVVFTPREDGGYLLGVADTRGMGSPLSVYRIEIEPASDSTYVYVQSTAHDAFETNRVTGFIVPQGNRWTINVLLAEGQGNRYHGELRLEARHLPAGVRMIAPVVQKNQKTVPVEFLADESTPEQTALIELTARPVDSGGPFSSGSRQGIPFVNHSGGHAWHYISSDRFALAVTSPAPFHIDLAQPSTTLAQAGEMPLKVKLARHGDFKEPVDFQLEWLPPGVGGEPAVTIQPGQAEARFMLNADANAVAGQYKIAAHATTTGGLFYSGVGRIRVSSEFVDLTVGAPYLAVNIPRTAIERGRRAEIVCDVKQLRPFSGDATAKLARLPNGVCLIEPLPRITPEDRQVRFVVDVSPDALVGPYNGVICEITLTNQGQVTHQLSGSGMVRVDPARGGQ